MRTLGVSVYDVCRWERRIPHAPERNGGDEIHQIQEIPAMRWTRSGKAKVLEDRMMHAPERSVLLVLRKDVGTGIR